jgi:hypothetical protein
MMYVGSLVILVVNLTGNAPLGVALIEYNLDAVGYVVV